MSGTFQSFNINRWVACLDGLKTPTNPSTDILTASFTRKEGLSVKKQNDISIHVTWSNGIFKLG